MIPRVYGNVGSPLRLEGTAYDFGYAIKAIEFSLDEGEHWTTYPTEGTTDYQNVNWAFDYTPDEPGVYVMYIRSVNEKDEVSPESAYVELEIS